jgi:DNA repair photolyase
MLAERSSPGRAGERELGAHGGVRYFEMTCRSVLNWVRGKRLSDFYSVNPYRGCEHGCLYCYARYTHEFLDRPAAEDFEGRIYVKVNAPEAFARDLRRAQRLDAGIHIGSATDPYQQAEHRFRLTRRLLEKLLPYRGLSVGIATKSRLVESDADLLSELARRHDLKVVMTCITLDRELQRELEPKAATTESRLETLARLTEHGVPTGLLLAPVLPGINDGEEQCAKLCARAREAGARSVTMQVLFLPVASKRRFFPWLASRSPRLHAWYAKAYRGREMDSAFRDPLRARLARARAKAGFGSNG